METKRQKQNSETIKRHFGTVLQQEGLYIYGSALVTVTGVKITPDSSLAKIYVSVYNAPSKEEVLNKLNAHLRPLKRSLAKRIRNHMRRMPDIAFYIDDMLDESYRVDALFESLKKPQSIDFTEEE